MICRTFSRNEVADILGVSPDSVITMEENGVLKRIRGVPGVKFRKRDIYALMHEDVEDCTPAAVNRLKRKIRRQREEITQLREALRFISAEAQRREAEV